MSTQIEMHEERKRQREIDEERKMEREAAMDLENKIGSVERHLQQPIC